MATTAPANIPVQSLQDILTALERHPEWRSALRLQLLGEELLELPAMFAKFASETTRRLDLLTTAMTRLTNDVGELKGAHAEASARAEIALIADDLDLTHRRIVPKLELKHMARDGRADLQDDTIKSFLSSDIIAETTDGDGETTYLAGEASYTGDLHDADRARSHAALIQRLTGRPCRAVIASTHKNAGLAKLIDRGEMPWHQLKFQIQPAS